MSSEFIDIPKGKLASILIYLEMRTKPHIPAFDPPMGLSLAAEENIGLDRYRDLFRKVGAPWLWFSRLAFDDKDLGDILHDPKVDVYVLKDGDMDVGLLELDRRGAGEVEVAFVGLTLSHIGLGAGRYLLTEALRKAWSYAPGRVFAHSCSFDHPGALGFYRHMGFIPYDQKVEIVDDPRVTGLLPRDAGPHIPLING